MLARKVTKNAHEITGNALEIPEMQIYGHHRIGLAKCLKNGLTFTSPSPISLLLSMKNINFGRFGGSLLLLEHPVARVFKINIIHFWKAQILAHLVLVIGTYLDAFTSIYRWKYENII